MCRHRSWLRRRSGTSLPTAKPTSKRPPSEFSRRTASCTDGWPRRPVRYLSLAEVLELHRLLLEQSGGRRGIRDLGALESAVAQPRATYGDTDPYPRLEEKAAALAFFLVSNHPFADGNKRVGHAALETFLILNGRELRADVDDATETFLALAASRLSREQLTEWVSDRVVPLSDEG